MRDDRLYADDLELKPLDLTGQAVEGVIISDDEMHQMRGDTHAEYLAEIADALDTAPREGTPADEPEGNRYITLSDTLARQLAQRLREIAAVTDNGNT